jgi:hypothetical protein
MLTKTFPDDPALSKAYSYWNLLPERREVFDNYANQPMSRPAYIQTLAKMHHDDPDLYKILKTYNYASVQKLKVSEEVKNFMLEVS